MKLAAICDTHWGIRNDHPIFLDASKKFLDDVFFPELEKRCIKKVIHLGDIVDRRKYININTLTRMNEDFIRPLASKGMTLDLILGNHDVYYKNTNDVNGPEEFFADLEHVTIFSRAWEAQYDGLPILFVPWINPENCEETFDLIAKTKAQVCFGHLELQGFEMDRGNIAHEGFPAELFSKFDVVASGHFHHKSSQGDIHYLGAHQEFTWADHNDERGFHIFDTDTREFEFIPNPYTIFEKVHYSTGTKYDGPILKDKFVKVIIGPNIDRVQFEQFMDHIQSLGPASLQTVDDHLNADVAIEEIEISESEDTLSIMRKAVSEAPFPKAKLNKFLTELYSEALSVE